MSSEKTPLASRLDVVINTIVGCEHRVELLDRELRKENLSYRTVLGTLGKDITPEQRARHRKSFRYNELEPNEIACALGHEECLQTFLETDKDYCLLLEDDALVQAHMLPILEQLTAGTAGWDFVMLEHRREKTCGPVAWSGSYEGKEFQLVMNRRTTVAVTAGIYTREGARKTIASLQTFSFPIDLHFRESFRHRLYVAEIYPSLVTERETPSIIGGRADNKVHPPNIAQKFAIKAAQNASSVLRWGWSRWTCAVVRKASNN